MGRCRAPGRLDDSPRHPRDPPRCIVGRDRRCDGARAAVARRIRARPRRARRQPVGLRETGVGPARGTARADPLAAGTGDGAQPRARRDAGSGGDRSGSAHRHARGGAIVRWLARTGAPGGRLAWRAASAHRDGGRADPAAPWLNASAHRERRRSAGGVADAPEHGERVDRDAAHAHGGHGHHRDRPARRRPHARGERWTVVERHGAHPHRGPALPRRRFGARDFPGVPSQGRRDSAG